MSITTLYDEMIKDAVALWLPEWDWNWLRAQFYQESLLKPDAVSSAGAKGICQFIDDTWADVRLRLRTTMPANASVFDPQYAIPGGVYYMALMRNGWAAPRPEEDRRDLAFSSYNAGFGNILRAQKLAGNVSDYNSIITQLPHVTGVDNARQTRTYVQRIHEYYAKFSSEALH